MGLKGKLGYRDIADLFNTVETAKKSGVMRINCGSRTARLFFEWGELIRAESNRFSDKIGAILVEHGAVTGKEVEEALELQRSRPEKQRLGCILCAEYGVSESDIQDALAAQFKAIVSDVVTWPGGAFEFDFELPPDSADRFTLSASEFLLEVGIEAGLLARQADQSGRRAVLAEPDPELATDLAEALAKIGISALIAADRDSLDLVLADEDADAYFVNSSLLEAFRTAAGNGAEEKTVVYGYGAGGGAPSHSRFVVMPEAAHGPEKMEELAGKLAGEAAGLSCGHKDA